jgi:hypothetical protein
MATHGLTDARTRTPARLFTVRLWKEEIAGGFEYRGHARDVVSGAFCSFRSWPNLGAFLVDRLEEAGREQSDRMSGVTRRT